MVKVYTKGNYVDFEAPIHIEEDQLQKFADFLKYLLNEDVEIQEVLEKERFSGTSEKKQKKWTFDELFMLLDPKLDNFELVKKLNRTSMSVSMHRAHFVPNFISWAKSKGYDSTKISQTLIKEFLEEQDENTKGQ